jgi:hypothetical protein
MCLKKKKVSLCYARHIYIKMEIMQGISALKSDYLSCHSRGCVCRKNARECKSKNMHVVLRNNRGLEQKHELERRSKA